MQALPSNCPWVLCCLGKKFISMINQGCFISISVADEFIGTVVLGFSTLPTLPIQWMQLYYFSINCLLEVLAYRLISLNDITLKNNYLFRSKRTSQQISIFSLLCREENLILPTRCDIALIIFVDIGEELVHIFIFTLLLVMLWAEGQKWVEIEMLHICFKEIYRKGQVLQLFQPNTL